MKFLLLPFLLLLSPTLRAQWTTLLSGTNQRLNAICFPAPDTGFVAGENGTLLRTTDGGQHWQPLATGFSVHWHDLHFVSPSTGWVVGDASSICRTTDGGESWSCTGPDTASLIRLYAVHALDDQNAWIGGQDFSANGYLARTTDGGLSWQPAAFETLFWDVNVTAIDFSDSLTGYAATRGYVLKTTDGGWSWFITDTVSAFAGQMFSVLEDLAVFPHNDTVYVAGWYDGYLGKSVNGGGQWTHHNEFQNYTLDFLDPRTGYVAGWCQVHKTTDGGATFTDAGGGVSDLFCQIYDMDFTDEWTGYACGYDGLILKTDNGGATAVSWLSATPVPIRVYPNPTRGHIAFSAPVHVRLHDILRQYQMEAENTSQLNLTSLPSGIYFLLFFDDKGILLQAEQIMKE